MSILRRFATAIRTISAVIFFSAFALAEESSINQVSVSWEALSGAAEYEIEISVNPTMKPTLISQKLKQNQIGFRVRKGSYFFRVRGVGRDGQPGIWSDIKLFLVNQFPPQLEDTISRRNEIEFNWKPGFNGTVYGFEIRESGNLIVSEKQSSARYRWTPTKPGKYQWRVGYETIGTIQWGGYRDFQVDVSIVKDTHLGLNEAQIFAHSNSFTLPGLRWKYLRTRVQASPGDEEVKLSTFIEGEWDAKSGELWIEQKKINPGSFRIGVPIYAENQTLRITARDVQGKVANDTIQIYYPRFEENTSLIKFDRARKHFFSTGLGLTFVSYSQTFFPDFTQMSVTGKVGYRAILSPHFDLGTSAFFTLFPVNKSNPTASAQFFGFNLRLGWIAPFVRRPWNLSLMGGIYYSAMLVSDRTFGYRNIFGPQLYPSLSHTFSNGNNISVYLKFSPITNGVGFFSLDNRELALGLAWGFPISKKNRVAATIDAADLALASGVTHIRSRSLTLGVAFQW